MEYKWKVSFEIRRRGIKEEMLGIGKKGEFS